MKRNTSLQTNTKRRRAVIAIQVGIMLVVLIGFAALTVDVGTLYNVRADLQRSADSSALAAVSTLVSDDMMSIRMGLADSSTIASVTDQRTSLAVQFGGLNPTFGLSTTDVATSDIRVGRINLLSAIEPLDTAVTADNYNAVEVTVRRESGGQSTNGPIEFYFAPIFGSVLGEASATAVAAFDDRVVGFDFAGLTSVGLPLSMDETAYNAGLAAGSDGYAYDQNTDSISSGADGIPEISIYPAILAPGNFGLLNIGSPNQGVPALRDQIDNGVSEGDMIAEIGTSLVTFYDVDGNPTNYQISGNPGLKVTLEANLLAQVGNVVGFFLHNGVTGTGANSVYNITALVFGRLMDVQLTGNPASRGVWIQPTTYYGGGIALAPNGPTSNGAAGRIVLVR